MGTRLIAFCGCSFITFVGLATAGGADEHDSSVEHAQLASDVRHLLKQRCLECHGDTEPESGLRLTTRANFTQLNDSGLPAVVAGESERSELLRRVTIDGDERMPPEGEQLTSDEIDLLRRWVDAQIPWVEDSDQKTHWAYVQPVRPALPHVNDPDWIHNEIDAFVLAKLEGFTPPVRPAPAAEPATLLRRVYLDLIGIPPTVEEVDAFLDNPSAEHYEQIIDALLDSPHYGEKWARNWLDLARYADSNGYQADQFREIWAYRDWVVDALNNDMPFDQFTIEQLAGDLLPQATLEQRIATGFHRCTTCNVEAGVDPEENRVNQIVDRVNTTGTVWLGTTLECAQCHNHKYDPFTQQDYYQLFAFFNNTPLEVKQPDGEGVAFDTAGPEMELPWTEEQLRRKAMLEQEIKQQRQVVDERLQQLNQTFQEWEPSADPDLPEAIRQLTNKSIDERTDAERERLKIYYTDSDAELTTLKKQLSKLEADLGEAGPFTTLIMVEQEEPRETKILKRGNFLDPGKTVEPTTPAVLHPYRQDADSASRLAFARWLVAPENPLVARVTVNRWWSEIFGRGIVETIEDFGVQGEQPTHPLLLDWLAVDFMENGWSMKHVHRLIVMSSTYQQSSCVSVEQREFDPANKWLARGPRFRLPAEAIRDNALAVSGLLSNRMGGPPVYPPQPPGTWRHTGRNPPQYDTDTDEDRFRRGLYVIWRRSAPYPSFVNFDAPDRAASCVKRSRTNTPLQALTLLNDPAYFEMAEALAERMEQDLPDASDRERIEYGFRRSVSRLPTSDEVNILHELFETELDDLPSGNPEPTAYDNQIKNSHKLRPRRMAWISVANTLLNLDETITKE